MPIAQQIPADLFVCAACKAELALPAEGAAPCAACGFEHRRTSNGLRYDPDPLLFRNFRDDYLLYKVLSNNGEVAYRCLADTSLSYAHRPEVQDFRAFIQQYVPRGRILDVGCGILPLPGYLEFADKDGYEFYGLDPLEGPDFRGVRITGSCEYLPFRDAFFDALVFGGSLDHVCSLKQTAREAARVLKPGGKLIVLMGDRSESLARKLKNKLFTIARNLVRGYRTDKFWVYDNLSVFYVPRGAIDPFHSFPETPGKIVRLMTGAGLSHLQTVPFDRENGKIAFLAFEKPR